MKALCLLLSLIALTTTTLEAATEIDMPQMKKEATILVKIIETALEESNGAHTSRFPGRSLLGLEPTYLAGQGLVLEIRLDALGTGFGSFLYGDRLFGYVRSRDNAAAANPYIQAIEGWNTAAADGDVEPARYLEITRDQKKALQKSLQQKAELEEVLGETDSDEEKAALSAKLAEAEKNADAIRAKAEAMRKQQYEEWVEKRDTIERELVRTLCDYGGTLRALPADEKLTLIFRNGERSLEGETADRVMIFSKKMLLDCRDGRIAGVEALIAAGTTYSF